VASSCVATKRPGSNRYPTSLIVWTYAGWLESVSILEPQRRNAAIDAARRHDHRMAQT
jgi:hypothetical protein